MKTNIFVILMLICFFKSFGFASEIIPLGTEVIANTYKLEDGRYICFIVEPTGTFNTGSISCKVNPNNKNGLEPSTEPAAFTYEASGVYLRVFRETVEANNVCYFLKTGSATVMSCP